MGCGTGSDCGKGSKALKMPSRPRPSTSANDKRNAQKARDMRNKMRYKGR